MANLHRIKLYIKNFRIFLIKKIAGNDAFMVNVSLQPGILAFCREHRKCPVLKYKSNTTSVGTTII